MPHRTLRGLRRALGLSLALAAATLITTVALPSGHTTSGSKPTAAAVQLTAKSTAAKAPLPIGIAYGDTLTWDNQQQITKALNIATTVGATWIRADLSWYDIQPDRANSYDWQRFDHVVAAARAHHLTVLPVIAYTPPWARTAGCTVPTCAPADPTTFAAFAAAAAKRYAPQGIHTWEVWNEENLGFWKPAPNPSAYATLLRQTSAALHAADPTARVVLGGLAATNTGPGRISPTDFLSAVAKTGALRAVNAVGYHPYTYPYLASTHSAWGTSWEKIDRSRVSLHSVLVGNGFPHLPIWVTEFGAPTGGPGTASDGSPKTITPSTTHVTEGR
ncbi:cellulase family glycosylhydrolase [Streptantibioticus rubrisoli]|uniref:Cellulase family glycosylhydrolase n=1 Tax=Streptantibioticus rubrisoli TaxID=1387313 RepID=A0ABT1PIY5_9ACTN|nr:cellulase family glycosylhydrolase [Streptantibioticus rubrisoli]MCQ4045320.1 cellulase family glycosylhydrolase [Streptantibioticus rubrisoli]